MALIYCPECGKQVSDKAAACPSCAYPLASDQTVSEDGQYATIQVTSKRWKKGKLIGGALMFLSIIIFAMIDESPPEYASGLVGMCFLAGFGIWLAANIGSWWHHG